MTSVLATAVWVMERTKLALLAPNSSAQNKPFSRRSARILIGLFFSKDQLNARRTIEAITPRQNISVQ